MFIAYRLVVCLLLIGLTPEYHTQQDCGVSRGGGIEWWSPLAR